MFDRSQNLGQNCWNFRSSFGQSTNCLGCLCCDLFIKSCFGVNEAGMAINIGLKSFEPSEKISILSGREQ